MKWHKVSVPTEISDPTRATYRDRQFHRLPEHGLIERPKTLTKKKYHDIEEILRKLAGKLNMTLAELDLYLWYMETGKILK